MLRKRPFEFPGEKAIRVICDTDAYNECDDQFCIAHLWMTPRFDVKAMIAAQYGHVMNVQGTEQQSYDELVNLATLMDIRDEVNILHGGVTALPDENTPVDSEGARFIIEEAMKDDPRPLFVCFLGATTDIASAYLYILHSGLRSVRPFLYQNTKMHRAYLLYSPDKEPP